MRWLLLDLALVLTALALVGLGTLVLCKRVKRLKGEVEVLATLAGQASDALATIRR